MKSSSANKKLKRISEREKWGSKRQTGPLISNFTNDGSFDKCFSAVVESEQDPESEEVGRERDW